MAYLKWLLVVVLALVGYHWWQKHRDLLVKDGVSHVTGSTGFVSMPQPTGTSPDQVLIFAPRDCPSAAAQRARELSRELAARDVPHAQLEEANFDLDSAEGAAAVKRVMEGAVPIVFVHGRAKANPSLDDVLAEYDAAQSRGNAAN